MLDAVRVPPDVDAPVTVAAQPGAEAVDRGLKCPGAAERDDELVNRALGARSRPLAPDHIDLSVQGLVKLGDLGEPAVVVWIVLIVSRVDRELERVFCTGTGHSAPTALWPHLSENFTTLRAFYPSSFLWPNAFTVANF